MNGDGQDNLDVFASAPGADAGAGTGGNGTGTTETSTKVTGNETGNTGSEGTSTSSTSTKEVTGTETSTSDGKEKGAGSAAVSLSKDDLKEILSSVKQQAGAPAGETKKPLTEAEIKKQLNYYGVSEADLQEVAEGGPKAIAAFQRMLDGTTRHALTVAQLQTQQQYDELKAMVAPHIKFAQDMQMQQAKGAYFDKNPTHVGLEPLIQQVARQMQSEKFQGDTQEKVFAEVAKRVDALASSLKIPKAEAGAATDVAKPGAGGNNNDSKTRMSTVSAGGQGQAGGSGKGQAGDSEDKLWG